MAMVNIPQTTVTRVELYCTRSDQNNTNNPHCLGNRKQKVEKKRKIKPGTEISKTTKSHFPRCHDISALFIPQDYFLIVEHSGWSLAIIAIM